MKHFVLGLGRKNVIAKIAKISENGQLKVMSSKFYKHIKFWLLLIIKTYFGAKCMEKITYKMTFNIGIMKKCDFS